MGGIRDKPHTAFECIMTVLFSLFYCMLYWFGFQKVQEKLIAKLLLYHQLSQKVCQKFIWIWTVTFEMDVTDKTTRSDKI